MFRRLTGALTGPLTGAVACISLGIVSVLALASSAAETGQAMVVGHYVWFLSDPEFGGFSGLELAEDGVGFTAITDKAWIATGRLIRQAEGAVDRVELTDFTALRDTKGRRLNGENIDAEGLASAPGGGVFISFEGNHRIAYHSAPEAAAALVPRGDFATKLQNNSGMEALAIDREGALWTLPERSGGVETPFPVWRFGKGKWARMFDVARSDGFLPVGADFGPDGQLYLLERGFSGFGFSTRLRRFDPAKNGVQQGVELFRSRTGQWDNFESIALWRHGDGSLRATLISDDNFHFLQRTEFLDLRLAQ
jgi:hypothetical protein